MTHYLLLIAPTPQNKPIQQGDRFMRNIKLKGMCCALLVLCSCAVLSEEAGLRRQKHYQEMREKEKACREAIVAGCPLCGKWEAMHEIWEFTSDGRVILISTDRYGKKTVLKGWYNVPHYGEIEYRMEGLEGSTPVLKGKASVHGCRLYFKHREGSHENVYYRVLK